MKNQKTLSIILAAGLAGVAFAQLANASFLAALPGDVVIAIVASAALVGFAVYDYSRRIKSISLPPAPVARPTLPVAPAPRGHVYGVRRRESAIVERTAA